MVGLSADKGNPYIKKMFENKKMKLAEQKIATTDVEEIQKQSDYYKKMEKIERARARPQPRDRRAGPAAALGAAAQRQQGSNPRPWGPRPRDDP